MILKSCTTYGNGYTVDSINNANADHPWHSINRNNEWISFEFTEPTIVNGIRYKGDDWADQLPDNFYFEYSIDGQQYSSLHTGRGANNKLWQSYIFSQRSMNVKYFKWTMINSFKTVFVIKDLELLVCAESNNENFFKQNE